MGRGRIETRVETAQRWRHGARGETAGAKRWGRNVPIWLFVGLKRNLRGKRFSSEEEIDAAVHAYFEGILKDDWLGAFEPWKERMSPPGQVTQAVKDAIDLGYRHIDCAHVYQNEKEVGAAISAKIAEGVVKREDLFITSKLWNTYHLPEAVEPALKVTLKNLRLDYLDLYLMHWPFAFKDGDDLFPTDSSGELLLEDHDYVDTWKALEAVAKKGLTKSIGISNFTIEQTERLLKSATIVPVTNQVECSPYLNQKELIEYSASKGITITAYSPLGSPDRPNAVAGEPNLLDDPKFAEVAKKYGKTPAQLVLRYQVQRGLITIPKSVTKSRIAENFNIFDFELKAEDVALLNSFDRNGRTCDFAQANKAKYYPF